MNEDLRALKAELEQQITAALTRKSMSNRGTFPPYRIPAAAKSLVAGMLGNAADQSAIAAPSLGQAFGQQGLGLAALLDAQAVAIEIVAGRFAGLDLQDCRWHHRALGRGIVEISTARVQSPVDVWRRQRGQSARLAGDL